MEASEILFAADLTVKLCRAIPIFPGESLPRYHKFESLVLRTAALLPSMDVQGLSEQQYTMIHDVIKSVCVHAKITIEQGRTPPAMYDLLRSLASDSKQREEERQFVSRRVLQPHRFHSHRYAPSEVLDRFGDALAQAELAHSVQIEGLKKLKNLNNNTLLKEYLGKALHTVSHSVLLWALPVLFDGLRLRCGLRLAAALQQGGPRPPSEKQVAVFSGGETIYDRIRVGGAAQFLLAAMRSGIKDYFGTEAEQTFEWEAVGDLEMRLQAGLVKCRRDSERAGMVPGKSMRIIIDEVAKFADRIDRDENALLALKLGLATPCLYPSSDLQTLEGYDGGALSVWDACKYLLDLNVSIRGRVDAPVTLMCSVLAGAVGHIVGVEGPFRVADRLVADAHRIQASWPASDEPTARATGKRLRTASNGKFVSANASVCDAILRRSFKAPRDRTALSEARFSAALTMRVISTALACDADTHPSEGITPLKKLYLVALAGEPGLPVRIDGTTPFVETNMRRSPHTPASDAIETPWRDVNGAALLLFGPLFAFTRHAFEDTLTKDWAGLDTVQQAVQQRAAGNPDSRSQPVMLPTRAMQLLTTRARELVDEAVTQTDNRVRGQDGPPRASQALEGFASWACAVYSNSQSGAFWESCLLHIVSPAKRPRAKKTARLF